MLQHYRWRREVERLQRQTERLNFVISKTVTKKPPLIKKILKEKTIQVPKGIDESKVKRLIEITPVSSGTITLVETYTGDFLASSSTVSEIFVESYERVPRFVLEPKLGLALVGSRTFEPTFFLALNVFRVGDYCLEMGLAGSSVGVGACRRFASNIDAGVGITYEFFDKKIMMYISISWRLQLCLK